MDVYFGRVAEPDPFREDPDQARWVHARGRLLLEYARDALGVALLRSGDRAREAFDAAGLGRQALEQLLATPRLPVNYALGEIHSEERGGVYVHRIEIVRDFDP